MYVPTNKCKNEQLLFIDSELAMFSCCFSLLFNITGQKKNIQL